MNGFEPNPEFAQMHEHLRQRDTAMVRLLTILIIASTSLFAAVVAFVFEGYSPGNPLTFTPAFYVLLVPTLVLIPGLAVLSGNRSDIYRMGTYIKTFHESKEANMAWHLRLEQFRAEYREESLDSVPIMLWTISLLSFAAFWLALHFANVPLDVQQLQLSWHWASPLAVSFFLLKAQNDFREARQFERFERIWKNVKATESQVRGDDEQGEGSARPSDQDSEVP